jgi:hypothetical protein
MIVVAAAIALAAVLVLGLIWLFPAGTANAPGSAGGPSGSDQLGAAPTPGGTATKPAGAGLGSGSPSPGVSATDTPSADPSGSPGADGVDLRASYQVTTSGLNTTVSVRITNAGTATSDGWTVVMKHSGVPLGVKPGPGVTYHASGGELTFTPPDADRKIAPGDVVGFSYTVTGLGGQVQSCSINGRACTAA